MISFTTYTELGKIISTGSIPVFDASAQVFDSALSVLWESANLYTDYVDISTQTIKSRTDLKLNSNKQSFLANGLDSIILSELPVPCTVTIDENTYEVSDGEFEFTTDTVGVYQITVESVPYFPATIEVTAI